MQSTILQDRMTGNLQDHELAFQAAEAALREAESLLRNNTPEHFTNSGGLYRVGADNRPNWLSDIDDGGNGTLTYGEDIDRTSSRPVYYIEQIDSIMAPGVDLSSFPEPVYYRITAKGFGGSEDSVTVITTVFKSR